MCSPAPNTVPTRRVRPDGSPRRWTVSLPLTPAAASRLAANRAAAGLHARCRGFVTVALQHEEYIARRGQLTRCRRSGTVSIGETTPPARTPRRELESPSQRSESPKGFFAFLPWLVLHSALCRMSCGSVPIRITVYTRRTQHQTTLLPVQTCPWGGGHAQKQSLGPAWARTVHMQNPRRHGCHTHAVPHAP